MHQVLMLVIAASVAGCGVAPAMAERRRDSGAADQVVVAKRRRPTDAGRAEGPLPDLRRRADTARDSGLDSAGSVEATIEPLTAFSRQAKKDGES